MNLFLPKTEWADIMIRIADHWFTRSRIDDDITHLIEPYVHPFFRCNIWHVRGRDRDMLVDTGMGIASLCEAACDLFDKPLTAVATHSHFDHVGGLHEFEDCAVHKCEAEILAADDNTIALSTEQLGADIVREMRAAGYDLDDGLLIDAVPFDGFEMERQKLKPVSANRILHEGDVLDLGNRQFEVLHLPGHSPGSIGLYEKSTQILFSGDAIYDGPLLGNLPGSDIPDYLKTLKRLVDLPVRVVHGGHDSSFGPHRLKQIAEDYLRRWGA